MSKEDVNVDVDLWEFIWGIAFGLVLAFILSIASNTIHGRAIEKDDKICISGHQYRVINIDDLDRIGDDVTSFTIKLNVNKL